jgi:dTDP-4-dehydrorhamnose reductase
MSEPSDALELWGGHECTVNRVGDAWFDQTVRSGHEDRIGDLDLFASLGITKLRYPVLWERIAKDGWAWTDARLERLRSLRVAPIAGLIHHGSGPGHTSLIDPGFAKGLAAHARAAAERYPWIDDWTPVNEPLTTARFSALYGHWYPHLADEKSFWLALLNQIEATGLSMAAIRSVNPQARLIQTEDLGKTYSTRTLARQARHDNLRRWMTWDLLCGKVGRDHGLYTRISRFGLEDRLKALLDTPCPPDVLGVNHYLTSDRFLDHRCERYPPDRCGANEFMNFADVEAVRVALPAPGGLEERLEEAWDRYGITMAVTESHNGCTREEQMRWLADGWDVCKRLRGRNVDVKAFTAWSLLGAHDWDSLLTRQDNHYEPGPFDLRGGAPRPTASVGLLRSLTGKAETPPVAVGPGWWRRDIRLQFQPVFRTVDAPEPRRQWSARDAAHPPLLICGATGTLGRALARACEWRGLDYVLTGREMLDLSQPRSIEAALDLHQPWAVINAAGWVRVDDAETQEAACFEANTYGCARLAQACARHGVRFAGFSTDLVFDGAKGSAYGESDSAAPLNTYGRSKLAAELAVLEAGGLMARTAAFFSPYDSYNFPSHVARSLARGNTVTAARDLVISPTYVPDLVDAVLDLVIDGETGLWHLANGGEESWASFAGLIAKSLDLDTALIVPVASADINWAAPRPAHVPLISERAQILPTLDDAVARYAAMMMGSDFKSKLPASAGHQVILA